MRRLLLLIGALCSITGCLTQESRHVFYLDADGAVTWTVVEEEVRSDDSDPSVRFEQEREYIEKAARGRHDAARALRELGPLWVQTTIVRDVRPFTVITEARFESAARMLESFLIGAGLRAEARLERDGELMRLSFRFDDTGTDADVDDDLDERLQALYADTDRYRFVLTAGRFVGSQGFELDAGKTAAVMLEQEPDSPYVLTWRVAPPA